jgi:hypothetical protein
MSEAVKLWSTPQEPYKTGPCGNARCTGEDCMDPKSVELEVDTKTYAGTAVVLTYVDEEGCQKLAINGFAFAWNDVDRARRYADALFGEDEADGIMRKALEVLV